MADIEAYCRLYEIPVELHVLADCIFAIDNDFLDESHKAAEKRMREMRAKAKR